MGEIRCSTGACIEFEIFIGCPSRDVEQAARHRLEIPPTSLEHLIPSWLLVILHELMLRPLSPLHLSVFASWFLLYHSWHCTAVINLPALLPHYPGANPQLAARDKTNNCGRRID